METAEQTIATALNNSVNDKLFKARNVIISGEINQKLAGRVSTQLLAMSEESDEPITLFINSQGGHVEAGDTIHDMIKFVKPRVRIVGTGWVASAGALIYVAAPLEDRYCLPNTRFLLHQPMGGARGQVSDIAIEAEQIVKMRGRLNQIFADATGQPVEKIAEDSERNFWLTPEQAIEYGLLNRVIGSAAELD
ncbi:MAG: ATP-dependent Clp protease proteolytic subunit [Bacteroidota bacterium]